MQVGASRTQLIVLGILVVIALFSFSYLFSGSSTQGTPAAGTAGSATAVKPASTARAGRRPPPQGKSRLTPSLDPALRKDLLAMGETYEYDGSKRNIFSSQAEVKIERADGNGMKPGPITPPQPVTPPGPPPIPLKFYGFATQPGQAKRVFLSSGDLDVFVGTEGQVINKRYRIVKINNNSVEIEDILNHNTQSIPLASPS